MNTTLPDINIQDVNETTFYGHYATLEELAIAINKEINGLNIFRVINEEGRVQNYTFEVEE